MNSAVLLIILYAVSSKQFLVFGGNVRPYFLQGNEKYSVEKHGSTAASHGKAVERPLLVGSFNVQTLGKKKLTNSDVSRIVEEVSTLAVYFFILEDFSYLPFS